MTNFGFQGTLGESMLIYELLLLILGQTKIRVVTKGFTCCVKDLNNYLNNQSISYRTRKYLSGVQAALLTAKSL